MKTAGTKNSHITKYKQYTIECTCGGERLKQRDSEENIEPNSFSDTSFYVKLHINSREFGPTYNFSILSHPII